MLKFFVNWSVTKSAGSSLFFNAQDCTVIHGVGRIRIIRETCFSRILGVKPLSVSRSQNGYEFQTFKVEHETARTQKIECSIKICMDGTPCPEITDTVNCPNTGDAYYYYYEAIQPPVNTRSDVPHALEVEYDTRSKFRVTTLIIVLMLSQKFTFD